jgi:hypothetical protein
MYSEFGLILVFSLIILGKILIYQDNSKPFHDKLITNSVLSLLLHNDQMKFQNTIDFHTRQTFLVKMHNPDMRRKFLNYSNQKYNE